MAENVLTTLMEAPNRLNKFIDACTCGRTDKAAITAIKKELEAKDGAIERLEEEIRRKDQEKDNLIHMQKDLQAQIEEIRMLLDSHASEAQATATGGGMSSDKAALLMQLRKSGDGPQSACCAQAAQDSHWSRARAEINFSLIIVVAARAYTDATTRRPIATDR